MSSLPWKEGIKGAAVQAVPGFEYLSNNAKPAPSGALEYCKLPRYMGESWSKTGWNTLFHHNAASSLFSRLTFLWTPGYMGAVPARNFLFLPDLMYIICLPIKVRMFVRA